MPVVTVRRGEIDALQHLINAKVAIEQGFDQNQRNVLQVAIYNRAHAIVELLLRQPRNVVQALLHHASSTGETALLLAVKLGDLRLTRMLLDAGASVRDSLPTTDETALHILAASASTGARAIEHAEALIELLLERRADLEARCTKTDYGAGLTPLTIARLEGNDHLCSVLIGLGADDRASRLAIERAREYAKAKGGSLLHFLDQASEFEQHLTEGGASSRLEAATSEAMTMHQVLRRQRAELHRQQQRARRLLQQQQQQSASASAGGGAGGWPTVRIFLSSTFKDMSVERDLLVKRVIPRLRERCSELRLHLEEVDLRWGILANEPPERIIESCLETSLECDIFCGLVGHRLGWVPERHHVPRALQERYRWRFGASITEMEAVYGALERPRDKGAAAGALFFLRSEKALATVPERLRGEFCESTAERRKAIEQFRHRIQHCGAPCFDYSASFVENSDASARSHAAPLRAVPGSLVQLEQLFEAECWKLICATPAFRLVNAGANTKDASASSASSSSSYSRSRRAGAGIHQASAAEQEVAAAKALLDASPLEQELSSQNDFVAMRTKTFVGRTEQLRAIDRLVHESFASGGAPITICGSAGSGKSALVAQYVSRCQSGSHDSDGSEAATASTSQSAVVCIAHFVGASPSSTDVRMCLWRLCCEIQSAYELDSVPEIATDMQQLVTQFTQLLELASEQALQRPLLIVIDAVNQFSSSAAHRAAAAALEWLPARVPPNVALVLSTLPGSELDVLQARGGPLHHVPPLSGAERRELVSVTLARHHKRLDEAQMQQLLSKPDADNALYLVVACEELRVFGDFEHLSRMIAELPGRLAELLDSVIERMELEHSPDVVRCVLSCLVSSRHGLLEHEELLPILHERRGISDTQWRDIFLSLKFYLRPLSSAAGATAGRLLDFFHQQIAKSVRRRYLPVPGGEHDRARDEWQCDVHRLMASHFERQYAALVAKGGSGSDSNPIVQQRVMAELPYHLLRSRQESKLLALLSSLEFVRAKCLAGLTYDLVQDYVQLEEATRSSSTSSRANAAPAATAMFLECKRFVMSWSHALATASTAALQAGLLEQLALNHLSIETTLARAASALLAKHTSASRAAGSSVVLWQNKPTLTEAMIRAEGTTIAVQSEVNCCAVMPVRASERSSASVTLPLVVTGDKSGAVRVWHPITGQELATVIQPSSGAETAARKRISAADGDTDDGKAQAVSSVTNAGRRINGVAFSPDGSVLVTAHGRLLQVWDSHTWQQLAEYSTFSAESELLSCATAACTTDAAAIWIAATLDDGSATVLKFQRSTRKLSLVKQFVAHAGAAVTSCAFSPTITTTTTETVGSKKIAARTVPPLLLTTGTDKVAKLWPLPACSPCVTELRGHSKVVKACAFGRNADVAGELFCVTASQDASLRVWHRDNGQWRTLHQLLGHSDNIEAVCVTPDGNYILSGGWDKSVRVWHVASGKQVLEEPLLSHSHFVNCLACFPRPSSADGQQQPQQQLLSGSVDMTAKISVLPSNFARSRATDDNNDDDVDAADGEEEPEDSSCDSSRVHSSVIRGCAYSATMQLYAAGSWDRSVTLVTPSGAVQRRLRGHGKRINAVRFSPAGDKLVSAAMDQTLRVWDTASGECVATLRGQNANVLACDVSHDGRYIASGGSDGSVMFWELETGATLGRFKAHAGGWVCTIRFAPHSRLLLTGSTDGVAKIWRTRDAAQLATLRGHTQPILWAHFTSDGRFIVTAAEDRSLRVWDCAHGFCCVAVLVGHTHEVTACDLLDDERTIVSVSSDKTMRFYDLAAIDEAVASAKASGSGSSEQQARVELPLLVHPTWEHHCLEALISVAADKHHNFAVGTASGRLMLMTKNATTRS